MEQKYIYVSWRSIPLMFTCPVEGQRHIKRTKIKAVCLPSCTAAYCCMNTDCSGEYWQEELVKWPSHFSTDSKMFSCRPRVYYLTGFLLLFHYKFKMFLLCSYVSPFLQKCKYLQNVINLPEGVAVYWKMLGEFWFLNKRKCYL